jgi:hypothetical protein
MKAMNKFSVSGGLLAVAFGVGFLAGRSAPVAAQPKDRVFELRIATVANKEKLKVLTDRFRGGEVKIWERLGMKGVGFWVPTDSPKSENVLIYILAHEDRQKADEAWEKFRTDPEWLAFMKTPDLGPVTVDRTFMAPVDFSAIR